MNGQVLSIEQMQHLKELGIDTSKASCYIWEAEGKEYLYWGKCEDANGIPTFTLPDILELLPKEICGNDITIYHHRNYWCIYYYGIYSVENKSLIDAAYEMLCCCLENGDIKVKENNHEKDNVQR